MKHRFVPLLHYVAVRSLTDHPILLCSVNYITLVFCSITVREAIMCQIERTFFNNLDGMNVKISTPLTSTNVG
jgi:hypothetical protein